MTREDAIKILSMVRANYPIVKISDPAAMVSSWEMTLGDYDTDLVVKAVKFHMMTSKFFPTPADIIEHMTRADLIYKEPLRAAIQATRAKVTAIPDGMSEEEFLDGIWNSVIETEREIDEQRTNSIESSILGRSLPYEE